MLPEKYKAMPNKEILMKIKITKSQLGDKVLILGHHYQRNEVIGFADKTGDSLKLAIDARDSKSPYIVFCGVRFMAETADIITSDSQKIILPDLKAGCPMADMVDVDQLERVWNYLGEIIDIENVIPVTYVNSSAETKAFCGMNNGIACTSSNAEKVMQYIVNKKKRILFLPDRNLGINTAKKMGIKRENILLWDRIKKNGGLERSQIQNSEVIVWDGYCPVHMRFNNNFVKSLKKEQSNINILVHPEVSEEVAELSDYMGSTQYIIKTIEKAEKKSSWAIGTEMHLVSRLADQNPDKHIQLLDKTMCICSTMYKISSRHLLWILENLLEDKVVNEVSVNKEIAVQAKKAIDRMFSLS